ncbi:DUF2730 domain-containing protein [Acinetobacter ursingii]|uniref:DUF2730 domain-containing protein n=1 Tax=Acinetobacter ursingii TaxID=108980 RepID=UPI0021CD8AB8|nr:DUF2730 domain-containing protein [Acinetobacter ursingii]MCU4601875.1 DUF2730 domain-containing protein [Acinetobacter ursingii]
MFEKLQMGFDEVQWVVTSIIIILMWYLKRESASAKEVLDLRLRVIELENSVKDLPSKLDIANLQGEMRGINEKLLSTNDRISSTNDMIDKVERGVERLSNYLLENKK